MIVSKTNIKGIDTVIDSLQNELYLKLVSNWLVGSDYEMYPRANKLLIGNELLPVVSTDEQDYNLTLFDDRFSATSFFYPDDNKIYSPEGGGITQRVHLVFQVDLKELYDSNERLDEVFNTEVLQLINRYLSYVIDGDVEVTEGVEEVYSAFRLNNQTKINIMTSDTSHFHVVRFSFDVLYDIGCAESTVSSCFPVNITVNGELMTVAPSGDTVAITIDDTLGDPQGERVGTSFKYIVPAGFEVTRLYAPPVYSGAIDRGDLYDSFWRKDNNIGNLTQPIIGIQMRYAFGRQDILDPAIPGGNVFGNYNAWTGVTGGYLDWATGIYYDVNDNVTTRELAFPDAIAVNHVWNMLVQIDQDGTTKGAEAWRVDGQTLTIGAYTGWYLPSFTEIASMANFGVLFGYNNPPLFNWGSGLKLTADTYPAGTSQAMAAQSFSHITSRSKTSSSKAIYIKYIDINADFGT